MTTLNILKHEAAEMLLFRCMVADTKSRGLSLGDFRHFHLDENCNDVDVELKINGMSVDFKKTLEEAYERLCYAYEEDVLDKAKELLSKTRFEKLESILSEAEWKIEQELEELMRNDKCKP